MPPNPLEATGTTVVQTDRRVDRARGPTDRELFARIADGSSEAFAELYERYFHELYDFAARVTRDRAAAADLVQGAFTAAWERAQRGEDISSPRAWLYRITHNAAIDELRRRSRTTGAVGHDDFDFAAVEDVRAEEPTRVLIEKELAELVWETAATMDPREYALLDLHVRRGLEPDELAEQLSISPGAVHTRLSRLRRSFEEALTAMLLTRRGGRDCRELAALLTALRDTAERRAAVRAHIRSCSTCQAARRRHVTAAAILANLAPVPLMPGVQDAIWAELSALLGLSAAGGTAAAHGAVEGAARAGRMVGRSGYQVAAGATVAGALVAAVGVMAYVALAPARPPDVPRDPVRVWSPSNSVGRPSMRNHITIAWFRQPAATAYSVLWSHGARDVPDTVADLPGTAIRTTSRALAPGRWYFHLRTRGGHGGWTHTVHLGPFIVLARAASGGATGAGPPAPDGAGPPSPPAQPPAAEPRPPAAEPGQPEEAGSGVPTGAAPPPLEPGAAPPEPEAADTTAPSGQAIELAGGAYLRTRAVRLVLSPGGDLGSGVDPASGVVQRQTAVLSDGECGSWSGWQRVVLHAGVDSTVADGRCYRYRYRVSDRAGNASPFSVPSGIAMVDTTAPTTPDVTLATTGPDTAATGSTVFYRPSGAGGTFAVTAASADAGSGLAAAVFPALGAGMSPTAATRQTVRPYALSYTWVSGAASAGVETVTVFDRAGNSSASTFRIESDSRGPDGSSVSLAGGPWFTAPAVPLLISQGADGGAGLLAGAVVLQRDEAPLVGGACGVFPGAWSPLIPQTSADTSVVGGRCYRYRASVSDRVGNRSTSPYSGDARIDPSPPSLGNLGLVASPRVHVSDTTVYYRPGVAGSLRVTAPASDPESGIDGVTFPVLPGATGGGGDDMPPYETRYAWADGLAATGIQAVSASNRAGARTTSGFTLVPDRDPPTGSSVRLRGGPAFTGSVRLSVDAGTDTGSGVDSASVRVERDPAPLAPDGTCGRFTGAWNAVSLQGDLDAHVTSGTCYRYRVVVGDNVGNRATSPPSETAIVSPPPAAAFVLSLRATSPTTYASGTTLFYRPGLPGSFVAEARPLDGARVDSVVFPLLTGADGGGADDAAPFATAYRWIVFGATGPQPVTASNAGGGSAAVFFTLAPDGDAPTGVQTTVAGGWVAGPVVVAVAVGVDSGSGLDETSLRIERDTAPVLPDATCGTFAGNWRAVTLSAATDTSVADGTCYRYRAVIADNVGNRAVSAPSATVSVDTAPPTGLSVEVVGGSTHVGAVPLKVDWGADGGSGIDETSKLVERDSAPLASDETCGVFTGAWTRVEFQGGSTVDNGVARDTCYRYRAAVSDRAGNRAASAASDIAKVR